LFHCIEFLGYGFNLQNFNDLYTKINMELFECPNLPMKPIAKTDNSTQISRISPKRAGLVQLAILSAPYRLPKIEFH